MRGVPCRDSREYYSGSNNFFLHSSCERRENPNCSTHRQRFNPLSSLLYLTLASLARSLANVSETTPSKAYQYISKNVRESFDSLTNTTPAQAAHKLRVSTAEALQTMSNAISDGEDDISYEVEDQGNRRESRSRRSSRSGSFKLKKEKTKQSKY